MIDENLDPENKPAAVQTQQALEQAIKTVTTPERADEVINQLERMAQGVSERQVAQQTPTPVDAQHAAAAVQKAADVPAEQKPQAVIGEIAAQIAAADQPEAEEALSVGAQKATNPQAQTSYAPHTSTERQLLQEALLRRLKPFQKLDTTVFLAINNLPHPQLANDFFFILTTIFNRGDAWVAGLIVNALRNSKQRRVLWDVLPSLWATAGLVEGPIKQVFRRQRPFSSVVRAIVVGKKPGNYSFPSGHSAAAFAGAYLLSRHYPRLAAFFYLIAALVGFSRVYLGAHYPGDVASGAIFGTVLADLFRRLSRELAEEFVSESAL